MYGLFVLIGLFLVYAPSLDYFEDSEFLTILQIKKIAITFFIQLQEKKEKKKKLKSEGKSRNYLFIFNSVAETREQNCEKNCEI